MAESDPQIDALCRELYEKHGQAWRAIRNRLPSQRDELHNALGRLACQRLTRDFGGEWLYSLKRDRYARVYRPSWRVFGTSEAQTILGIESSSGFDAQHSSTHLRLAAGLPDDDVSERYTYVVKLKVSNRSNNEKLGARTFDTLSARGFTSKRTDNFTLDIRSRSGLPSVLTAADVVLDRLVTVRSVQGAVEAIDTAILSPPEA